MLRGSGVTLSALSLAASLFWTGCNERPSGTGGAGFGTTSKPLAPAPEPDPTPPEAAAPAGDPQAAGPEADTAKGNADPAENPDAYDELSQSWGLGELQDLGPAASATATPLGVVFVTRDDHIVVAKRKSGGSELIPLSLPKEVFAKYGRGPSVSKSHAYWVSERGKLMRASLASLSPEEIFAQARLGTRTSVLTVAGRDVVTFIGEVEKEGKAFVFASKDNGKHEIVRLTPDGTSASSVALIAGDPHPRSIALAGRLGMSPIHVRRIRVTPIRLTLEPDEIVWIAPGSHALTEIFGIRKAGDHAVAFLPTAKDFNDFGLAQLTIEPEGGEIPEPQWQIYKNGLDPAPVATAELCGKPHVFFARPTEQRPHSPQELRVAPIEGSKPQDGEVIGRSRAYADLSVAPTAGGAILAWTADHRTWGMVIECPQPPGTAKGTAKGAARSTAKGAARSTAK